MSWDGSKIAGNIRGVGIFMSSDSGVTWSQALEAQEDFSSLTMSSDGTKLAAFSPLDKPVIYLSSDAGSTWNTMLTESVGFKARSFAMSSAGYMVAAESDANEGALFVSEDSGSTWKELSSVSSVSPKERWVRVDMSPGGTKILAKVDGGDVWLISRESSALPFSWLVRRSMTCLFLSYRLFNIDAKS